MSTVTGQDTARAIVVDGASGNDDTVRQFLGGHLGAQLGLTSEQLRVGLTVARNHLERGNATDAMRIYVALVLCEPLNVDFQVGLANCASFMEEHHVALQAASAVIALAPADPRGYLLSGRSCLKLGSFEEAREDLADALRLAGADASDPVAQEATMLLDRLSAAMTS